ETLYNLQVEDHHTYFVGCDEWGFSVWAHNANCWNDFQSTVAAASGQLTTKQVQKAYAAAINGNWNRFQKILGGRGFKADEITNAYRAAQGTANQSSGHYIIFNKQYKPSQPPIGTRKGAGPNGGDVEAHHVLQNQWAEDQLHKYITKTYETNKAPTITIEKGKAATLGTATDAPHTIINNLQNGRRDARLLSGGKANKWNTTLNQELANSVSDMRTAGFSRSEVTQAMESVYNMLDHLGASGYTKPKI
ncbi:MAG: hypothetical protein MN733_19580, partial [Nitrososphaera sp.]|nr:hypothetical protein [Nitrososphaera sp.]